MRGHLILWLFFFKYIAYFIRQASFCQPFRITFNLDKRVLSILLRQSVKYNETILTIKKISLN